MTIIKNRRGTASQWTTANPILAEGEIGFETDTGKHKIGNGVSAWPGLHYFVDESGLSASYVPKWKAATAYLATALVLAPDGKIIQRIADGTSRATYDTTEQAAWTVISAAALLDNSVTALSSSAAPTRGTTTKYDASAAARTPTLPALSGLSVGDTFGVQKSDVSPNTVTFTCAGSDAFDSGVTTFTLRFPELRYLKVVTVSGTKFWKVVDGNTPQSTVDAQVATRVPLSMPAGFPALPCNIYRDGPGDYSHDFDFSLYKTGGTEVHAKMAGHDNAQILGTTAPVNIVTGGDLVVAIDGGANVTVTLTAGQTPNSVAAALNTALGAGSATAAFPIGGVNLFRIKSIGTGVTTSVQIVSGGGTTLANLGLATGTNIVDGTAANPYRTPTKALAKVVAGASGTWRVITDIPMTFRDEFAFAGTLTAKTVSIISTVPGGTLVTSNAGSSVSSIDNGGISAYTWTLGAAGTYSTSRTGVQGVLDSGVRDKNGLPVALVQAASLAACEATPGTWIQVGSLLWVHRLDGLAPTSASTVVTINVTGFDPILASGSKLYTENIIFCGWSNGNGLRVRGDVALTGGETFVAQRCGFVGTTGNGYMTYELAKTYLFDCVSAYQQLDGFNYSFDPATWATCRANTLVLEFNCRAYHLGIETPGAGSNNVSTCHNGANVVRVNGRGHDNTGASVIDVNGCRSLAFGYEVRTPVTSGVPGVGTTYLFSADSSGEPAEFWLYDCAADDSTVALNIGSNTTGHLARFKQGPGSLVVGGTLLYDI